MENANGECPPVQCNYCNVYSIALALIEKGAPLAKEGTIEIIDRVGKQWCPGGKITSNTDLLLPQKPSIW